MNAAQTRTCGELFFTFFRIGLFTFGGGYAMIPIIEHICVEQKAWITREEMMDVAVIAESTPGPIAINCATYVGYRRAGLRGALAATAGVVLPSLVIIMLIARFLDRFMAWPIVENAFRGIRLGVGALILDVGLRMLKDAKRTSERILAAISFAVMLGAGLMARRVSSILLILAAAGLGALVYALRRRGGGAA